MLTLETLNHCSTAEFIELLEGIYEHTPWVAERSAARRPFKSLTALKSALQHSVANAPRAEQLQLIRAHPELAGKQAAAGTLTQESTAEQSSVGLNRASAGDDTHELETIQQLNAAYLSRFAFPFVLAVKGHDGRGLPREAIIAAMRRRLKAHHDDEIAESLRQIGRIAELRLNQRFGFTPELGATIVGWCETLAQWSDDESGLTCTYLSHSHRRCAALLRRWMEEAGMQAHIDAIGNVVGRYRSDRPQAKTLLTGSHYDTVRNGGKYDGRAGVLLPIAVIGELHRRGEKLPFHVEVIGFADEEGVRYQNTFLGSSAIIGEFDMSLLERTDADGITMRAALQNAREAAGEIPRDTAGATSTYAAEAIPGLARNTREVLGFVEVHIEQGPVLLERDLPVGIVSSIAGSCRYLIELTGVAGHAGTTPMALRRDAATAAAEIILLVEQRCGAAPTLVGTVGQLQVPGGSINVVPGLCRLSLDIRAADDGTRDVALADILLGVQAICARRRIDLKLEQVLQAQAAPCAPWLMQQLGAAAERAGIDVLTLPSGAGHDAMAMGRLTDVAMLFVRCGNGGISHNPLETVTADDIDVSARIFADFLQHFTAEQANR